MNDQTSTIPTSGYLKGTRYRLPNTDDFTRNDKNL